MGVEGVWKGAWKGCGVCLGLRALGSGTLSVSATLRSWFWCTFWMCVREWRVREWRVRGVTRVREWRVSASGACPRVARVREWHVSACGASASGACPRAARPRVARVRQWRVGDGCGGCVEGDVEGVWSVLGTPRSWFWYTFCICDSPFLVLVHFLDVWPRVARPRVARP